MPRRSTVSFAALFLACVLGPSLNSAPDSERRNQKLSTAKGNGISEEQQNCIFQAFIISEADFKTFTTCFPGASFRIIRLKTTSSDVSIATAINLGEYGFSLILSATFSTDFTKLVKINSVLFGAYDERKKTEPGESKAPLKLNLADMDKFCQDPYVFLSKKFESESKP